jgi:hypothetical protein
MPNSIRPYNTNPQGLSTFQSTYQFLVGSILNQNGTTDTAANSDTTSDPGFGKTPQALKLLQARENTRDNWDRFMMEPAEEELYDGFVNLVSTKQPKPINLDLFDEEIDLIKAVHPDVDEILKESDSGSYAMLTVSKDNIGDTNYKYYIDANSTLRKDDAEQADALTNLLMVVAKIPGLNQELAKSGLKYNVGEHIKRIFAASGVEGYDKIVTGMTEQEIMDEEANQQQGNLNQPPQMPGGMGGETQPAAMAEPQSPQGMQMGMEQPGMTQPQMPMTPQSVNMNPVIEDPQIAAIANQLFGGQQ